MKYEVFTAIKYLRSKKDDLFISKLLSISILTVTLAITIPVVVLSVINGFHHEIKEKIIGGNFHIKIGHRFHHMSNYKDLLEKLRKHTDVALAVPFFEAEGVIKEQGTNKIRSVIVKGFHNKDLIKNNTFIKHFQIISPEKDDDPSKEKNIFKIDRVNGIVIGKALSRKLHTYIDDEIKILIPQGDISDPEENIKTLKVTDLYSAGYAKFNLSLVFINFEAVQKIFELRNLPTNIGVNLIEGSSEYKFINQLKKDYPDLLFTNIKEEGLFKDFNQEKKMMSLLLYFLIFTAFLTIYIALNVVVMDKRREIGVLKAIGSKIKSIQKIFVLEGFLISFVGVLLGNLLGFLITTSLTEIVHFVEAVANIPINFYNQYAIDVFSSNMIKELEIFDTNVFYIDQFPYHFNYRDILFQSVGAVLVSILAAYFPSKKASKQNAAESLKL